MSALTYQKDAKAYRFSLPNKIWGLKLPPPPSVSSPISAISTATIGVAPFQVWMRLQRCST